FRPMALLWRRLTNRIRLHHLTSVSGRITNRNSLVVDQIHRAHLIAQPAARKFAIRLQGIMIEGNLPSVRTTSAFRYRDAVALLGASIELAWLNLRRTRLFWLGS